MGGLPFQDPFRDDGVHLRDRLVGDAFVHPWGVPVPHGEGVRVDAVVVSLPVGAVLAFGASVAAIGQDFHLSHPRASNSGQRPSR